eukprot:CAMPEP_0171470342 /NCGR_PEP_ID=MMETSP0946-20130122/104_1 /TAXON_ID=109269 /ORGANISM="Vaucheria litorea, Strain CCMP2940" /LENGTH=1032 /DNA_ID=CAMNT_0011999727 /DNA_START=62 /DNA_END=3160 /DNA_ORIENTATION=+
MELSMRELPPENLDNLGTPPRKLSECVPDVPKLSIDSAFKQIQEEQLFPRERDYSLSPEKFKNRVSRKFHSTNGIPNPRKDLRSQNNYPVAIGTGGLERWYPYTSNNVNRSQVKNGRQEITVSSKNSSPSSKYTSNTNSTSSPKQRKATSRNMRLGGPIPLINIVQKTKNGRGKYGFHSSRVLGNNPEVLSSNKNKSKGESSSEGSSIQKSIISDKSLGSLDVDLDNVIDEYQPSPKFQKKLECMQLYRMTEALQHPEVDIDYEELSVAPSIPISIQRRPNNEFFEENFEFKSIKNKSHRRARTSLGDPSLTAFNSPIRPHPIDEIAIALKSNESIYKNDTENEELVDEDINEKSEQCYLRAKSMSPKRNEENLSNSTIVQQRMCSTIHNTHLSHIGNNYRPAFVEPFEPEVIKRLNGMEDPKVRITAISKFNNYPKDGILYLLQLGVIEETPEGVSDYIAHEAGLSKRKMGEYFASSSSFNQAVFECFLKNLDFKNLSLDQALRRMVVRFRMPGEAQQIDRIMEQFAKRWYDDNNPPDFSCADTAYVLSFSLMMLNTDMYNRNLKEGEKMTVDQFCNNNRGIDQGRNLPRKMLEDMYMRIQANEIRMDEGDMFESEIITFVAPKMSGWLKKRSNRMFGAWKRHWFVLVDGVLYYFFAPQDEAPRCIIPLEHITVEPIGATDIAVTSIQGFVKSVKVRDGGRMEQGNHKEFLLRADNERERKRWLESLFCERVSAEPGAYHQLARGLSPASKIKARRRMSFEKQVNVKVQPPLMRGWARTKNEGGSTSRRYCALFQGVKNSGPLTPMTGSTSPNSVDGSSGDYGSGNTCMNVLYFFGSSDMCDRMVNQNLHTSHGCINLKDARSIELRNMHVKGGPPKAIVLYMGFLNSMQEAFPLEEKDLTGLYKGISGISQFNSIGSGMNSLSTTNGLLSNQRYWILVPEEQFDVWVKAFIDCCPQLSHPMVRDEPLELSESSSKQKSPNYSGLTSKGSSPSRSRRFSINSTHSNPKSPRRSFIGSGFHSKHPSVAGSPL